MERLLNIMLWSLVAFAIILFIALIIVGDATYFRFLSSAAKDQMLTLTSNT